MFNDSSSANPSWLGFVLGLLGGAALSCLLIGLVLGYSIAGSFSGVGGGGGAMVAQQPDAPTPPPAPAAAKPLPPVTDKDHVLGNPNAPITIVEYSDFECPFCKRHTPTLKAVLEANKDKVNLVYRHFPLSFHQNAQKEAEASECAADVGGNDAFWKYHDAIFERSTVGGTGFALDKLVPLAKELGLNEAKFKACLDTGKFAQYVQDQMQAGIDAGVQGTPGNFVVNNKTKETRDISGAVPQTTFQAAIDEMLK